MPMNPRQVRETEFLVVADDGSIYPFANDAELDEAMRNDYRPSMGEWRVFKLNGFFSSKGSSTPSYTPLELPHVRKPEGR